MTFSKVIERVLELTSRAHEANDEAAWRDIENKLKTFLQSLTAAEIFMLTTLMYLGRDGGGVAGLMDQYQYMSETFRTPTRAIEKMLEKLLRLHDYWLSGLQKLTDAKIDLDTLLTTHIDSPLALLNDSEEVDLEVGPWFCDRCGEVIDQADEGLLQWLTRFEGEREVCRNLSIVHHLAKSPLPGPNGCYADYRHELTANESMVNDMPLDHMVEWDGLVILLSMLDEQKFAGGEVSRVIMRLFVPGYEKARPYFQKALETGVADPGLPPGFFYQGDLQQIIANIPRLEK